MSIPTYQERAQSWLDPFFDLETHQTIHSLSDEPKELEDRFYKDLEFGTGGMRGTMGVGTNRINRYTLGRNTQGLSHYLHQCYPQTQIKVAIAYDCRHQSDTLAKVVAEVFSANDIKVFLFPELRTTPALSFAVKHLGCHAGIVLTASHNPPEYNGYKVYWTDGGQIVPPQDKAIIDAINALDFKDVRFAPKPELIELLDADVDQAFELAVLTNGRFQAPQRENLNIVFTPLHGTSITAIPSVLQKAGYSQLHIVAEQAQPNGDFPTVVSPNPEETEALSMAISQAESIGADLVIGTDPDSDRLGIAARNKSGQLEIINGNQTMVLMLDFLLQQRAKKGFAPGDFIASTIVSTPMVQQLADYYQVELKTTLTGFKWIAQAIEAHPHQHFIGGGEESYGFMVGDFVRDKDAVTATLLACEIAAWAKSQGESLFDLLEGLYQVHGQYLEKLVSLVRKGKEGAQEIEATMSSLRQEPPHTLGGSTVVRIDDYLHQKSTRTLEHLVEEISLPKSNVLIFHTEDGSMIAARPSGTEPKIKFYISVCEPRPEGSSAEQTQSVLEQRIQHLIKDLGIA